MVSLARTLTRTGELGEREAEGGWCGFGGWRMDLLGGVARIVVRLVR